MIETAAAAIALLAPYLKQVGSGMANKAGEGGWAALGSLLSTIREKFRRDEDPDAEKALSAFEADPDDSMAKLALTGAIAQKASADTSFSDDLRRAVEAAQQTEQRAGDRSAQQSISIGRDNYGAIRQSSTQKDS